LQKVGEVKIYNNSVKKVSKVHRKRLLISILYFIMLNKGEQVAGSTTNSGK